MEPNATFYYFKRSQKFYDMARGVLPDSVFDGDYVGAMRARALILRANHNHMPGLTTTGPAFSCVVVRDDLHKAEVPGWPILLPPVDDEDL